MPALKYRKYYAKNNIAAYAQEGETADALFVFATNDPNAEPDTLGLQALFTRWDAGHLVRRVPKRRNTLKARALYFCQRFELATLADSLDRLTTPDINKAWGKFAYWTDPVFNGKPYETLYPSGEGAAIQVGQMALRFDGQWPTSLDDFSISVDVGNAQLLLGFDANTKCRLYVDPKSRLIPTVAALSVPLLPTSGFVAGALGVSLPWPTGRADKHPMRYAGFLYQANPVPLPDPGEQSSCRTWRAQFADEVSGTTSDCVLTIDPRDDPTTAQWLAGELNSKLDVSGGTLHSSLFGTKGQRVHLQSGKGGCTRLGFVFDLMNDDFSVDSTGEVIFHPEGLFQIVQARTRHVRASKTLAGIGDLDVIAGCAATEFFSAAGAQYVEFVGGQPAFLVEGEEALPAKSRKILDDKKATKDHRGRVISSFVRFADAKGMPIAVPFNSEPEHGPLFEANSGDTEQLVRRTAPFGAAPVPMPIFPWAGYPVDSDVQGRESTTDSMRQFDATNLAQWRRLRSTPIPLNPLFRRRGFEKTNDPSLAVTPQGVLAEVTSSGYVQLLFGNPDSSNAARLEFSIAISATGSEIFQEVQQTLAGSQLFLVFDQPTADALATLTPAAHLFLRDFSFSVALTAGTSAKALSSVDRTVFIVKYFRGKSLAELVKDSTTWGLQRFLAPKPDSAGVERLAHLGGDSTQPIPEDLLAIWGDPDWQGILVLNLPIKAMPTLLEALRPGIKGDLHAHHLGLSTLPVRQADLSSGAPPRLGSAFGLVQYTKPVGDGPPRPQPDDHEPGTNTGAGDRVYSYVVNSLEIGFLNSQVSTFKAEVSVGFSHLFWDQSNVTNQARSARTIVRRKREALGSGVVLSGTYERRVKPGGGTEDVFGLSTNAEYMIKFAEDTSYLDSLNLKDARLSVVSSEVTTDGNVQKLKTLTAFISFRGDLKLRDNKLKIPLLKVRALHLAEFGFEFVYTPGSKDEFTFGFKADGLTADIEFDPPASTSSVLELLPVKLKGMMVALSKLVDFGDIGFQSIGFGGFGSTFHFGIVLELDLGSMGKLAGNLAGLRFPMIVGWSGGANKGVAFGIQFPTFNGQVDIGIQQFIRLRAQNLSLVRCPTTGPDTKALAIQVSNAKIVMFGKEWPDAVTSFAIIVPVKPSRRVSWALGVTPTNSWLKYIGGGQRIVLPGNPTDTKAVVQQFATELSDASQVCSLVDFAVAEADGWSVVAQFSAGVDIWFALSDTAGHEMYGLVVKLPALGEIDVLYRRVNDQLGIFSAEYTLPDAIRTIQVGAATVRLPTFRIEIHTDGGFLLDFGFPWQNDFARSCQVEITIFLGSGGFYYGRTSAAASDLLAFDGGYGYEPPDAGKLATFKAIRIGFAARVGIGRSFTIGILSAEASLTVFGGIEGAAAYPNGGGQLAAPTFYALKGFVGLMLDVRAQVSFPLIQARAQLLAYALVALEIRKELAKKNGEHYLLSLPTVISAAIGLTVSVDVQISIGCVSVTIHLSFSATWRIEETLGSLTADRYPIRAVRGRPRPMLGLVRDSFVWNTNYRCWTAKRDLDIFITVLPCVAAAEDVGQSGDVRPCAVGQMLLPVRPKANGFVDFAQFLAGWVLRPNATNGIAADEPIQLQEVVDIRREIHDADTDFWIGFQAALVIVLGNQFQPTLNNISDGDADKPFATIPFWPGTSFQYVPKSLRAKAVVGTADFVVNEGTSMQGDDAGFANYCSCVIMGVLGELQNLLVETGNVQQSDGPAKRNDPAKFLKWGEIWTQLQAPLSDVKARRVKTRGRSR